MKYLILDLETQIHQWYGKSAHPNHPGNYIVGLGWAVYDDADPDLDSDPEGQYFVSASDARDNIDLPPLDDIDVIVGHNVGFDIEWLWSRYPEYIDAFWAKGGSVFDTMYCEYLLSAQTESFPNLDETAPDYGGTHKVDVVKRYWEKGIQTSAIPKEILYDRYLLGNVEDEYGDIANTRFILHGQLQKIKELKMEGMVQARMDGLIMLIHAMHNGLHIDREKAEEDLWELQQVEEALTEEVTGALASRLPKGVEFKFTSRFCMSALVYGGTLNAKVRVYRKNAKGEYMYEKGDFWKDSKGNTFPASQEPPPDAIKWASGARKGTPKVFRLDTQKRAVKWAIVPRRVEGLVDLRDWGEEFYTDWMRRFTTSQTLPDDSPVIKTGEDVLTLLMKQPGIPDDVLHILTRYIHLMAVRKDIGTYYFKETETGPKGMLQFLQPHNIINHELISCQTATGRLSSARPNQQNLPRKED